MATKEIKNTGFTASVEILADSLNTIDKDRLTTIKVVYPRVIEQQVLKHRSLTISSASSRAMRNTSFIKEVEKNTYLPLKFHKAQRGMVASEELLSDEETDELNKLIDAHYQSTLALSKRMAELKVAKEVANRFIEPYAPQTNIITGSAKAWELFFHLRCDSHADPVIQQVAELIKQEYESSTPNELMPGAYHIPFKSKIKDEEPDISFENLIFRSVASTARVSYNNTKSYPISKDEALYYFLIESAHLTAVEHIAIVTAEKYGKNGNFNTHWVQLRKLIEEDISAYNNFKE